LSDLSFEQINDTTVSWLLAAFLHAGSSLTDKEVLQNRVSNEKPTNLKVSAVAAAATAAGREGKEDIADLRKQGRRSITRYLLYNKNNKEGARCQTLITMPQQ